MGTPNLDTTIIAVLVSLVYNFIDNKVRERKDQDRDQKSKILSLKKEIQNALVDENRQKITDFSSKLEEMTTLLSRRKFEKYVDIIENIQTIIDKNNIIEKYIIHKKINDDNRKEINTLIKKIIEELSKFNKLHIK